MTLTYKVTVPANAAVGSHDVRLVSKWGVSNPRIFVVGDLNEVMEKEPNNDVEQAQRVEMNTTVNGVIATPTDVDYFVFKGGKGQRVVLSCLAGSIESRLHPGDRAFRRGRQEAGERTATIRAPTPCSIAPCPPTATTTSASSSSRTCSEAPSISTA